MKKRTKTITILLLVLTVLTFIAPASKVQAGVQKDVCDLFYEACVVKVFQADDSVLKTTSALNNCAAGLVACKIVLYTAIF
jgi:hypothetical protein